MDNEEIVKKAAKKLKISESDAEKFLETFVGLMEKSLAKDEMVTLKSFGDFVVCTRSARKGKDPKTKKPIDIPACKTVRFTLGEELKTVLNKGL